MTAEEVRGVRLRINVSDALALLRFAMCMAAGGLMLALSGALEGAPRILMLGAVVGLLVVARGIERTYTPTVPRSPKPEQQPWTQRGCTFFNRH